MNDPHLVERLCNVEVWTPGRSTNVQPKPAERELSVALWRVGGFSFSVSTASSLMPVHEIPADKSVSVFHILAAGKIRQGNQLPSAMRRLNAVCHVTCVTGLGCLVLQSWHTGATQYFGSNVLLNRQQEPDQSPVAQLARLSQSGRLTW